MTDSPPTIHFRGAWGYLWALIAVALLGWMLWAPQFATHETLLLGLRIWCTAFVVPELIGTYVATHSTGDEEVRTLSELLQRIGQMAHDGTPWWKSWNALVTGYALLVSCVGWLAFSPVSPVIGGVVAASIFFWNLYHWLKRWRYG